MRVAFDERRGCKTLGILCFDKYNFAMPLGKDEMSVGDTVHLRRHDNEDKE